MFKNNLRIAIAALALVVAMGPVAAATPDEAKAMCEKAAALVAAEGEKAFPAFNDPNGAFHQGELYVGVVDRKGTILAHVNPKLIGVNMWEAVDPDGVKFMQLMWKATENTDAAWISYKFANPESKKIELKKVWVHKVADNVVLVGVYVKQ